MKHSVGLPRHAAEVARIAPRHRARVAAGTVLVAWAVLLGTLNGTAGAESTLVACPSAAVPAGTPGITAQPAVHSATETVTRTVLASRFGRSVRGWTVRGARLIPSPQRPRADMVSLVPRASTVVLRRGPGTVPVRTTAGGRYVVSATVKAARGVRVTLQLREFRNQTVVRQVQRSVMGTGKATRVKAALTAKANRSRMSVRIVSRPAARTPIKVGRIRMIETVRVTVPQPDSPAPAPTATPTPTSTGACAPGSTSPTPTPSSSTLSPTPTPTSGSVGPIAPTQSADPGHLDYWGAPVFRDEFNGASVDTTKWNVRSRSDLGLLPDASVVDPSMVTTSNGLLHVRADWLDTPVVTSTGPSSPNPTERWHKTGYLDTRVLKSGNASFAQQYGRWEIRAKVPTGPNSLGALSAFWLRNSNSGEIDIMEAWGYGSLPNGLGQYPGGSTTTVFNNTMDGSTGKKFWRIQETLGSGGPNTLPADPVYNDFHTWALEFTPTYFKAYFDGRLYASETPATYPSLWNPQYFGSPLHIRINLHVGPSVKYWGLPDPTRKHLTQPLDYQIDYVRAWKMPGA